MVMGQPQGLGWPNAQSDDGVGGTSECVRSALSVGLMSSARACPVDGLEAEVCRAQCGVWSGYCGFIVARERLICSYTHAQIDRLFQATHPAQHVIIEAHPAVLKHMREEGVYDLPGVKVLEGRWQEWLQDKLQDALDGLPEGAFDVVMFDTFAEGYEGESQLQSAGRKLIIDLKAFFELLPDILNGPDAVFSFWNGLGATSEFDIESSHPHGQIQPSMR